MNDQGPQIAEVLKILRDAQILSTKFSTAAKDYNLITTYVAALIYYKFIKAGLQSVISNNLADVTFSDVEQIVEDYSRSFHKDGAPNERL